MQLLILFLKYSAHEVWTTLVADGTTGPFFIRTSEASLAEKEIFDDGQDGYICHVPILKANNSKQNISPGERATFSYLFYMINQKKMIKPGDLIIIDGESSLCTENVQKYLSDQSIYLFVLPSALHQFLNPCDNSFHSIFKQRYYRTISNMNTGSISVKEKFQIAEKCFHSISKETIIKMFDRCGLSGGKEKRDVVTGLMFEGIESLENHDQYHKKCLLNFLQWVKTNDLRKDLCPVAIKF